MVADGQTLCQHHTTRGAVVCVDCNKDVSIRPFELDRIRDRSYRQGLHSQVVRAVIVFKLGILTGIFISLVCLYAFYKTFY